MNHVQTLIDVLNNL